MLAVGAMSVGLQAIFFAAAVVCFVLAALSVAVRKINLVALGLAFFAFVWFWSALAAA